MESKQRTALVTGGMGGLGEAICIKLAALGDRVVTTFSPANKKAEEWLAAMRKRGFDFRAYPCDVSDWDSSVECVKRVRAEIGEVDVLVNNAGITRDTTFKKMDRINWDAVIHANLDSCFNMTKQVCDGMVERNWGRIINISSVNGQKGAFGQTNYAAAKAGMHGFTKALALEVARKGVTVNTSRRATSARRWSWPSPRTCWNRRSFRRSRSAGWASPRRWRDWWPIWPARRLRS
jgi:acetoacetyl-CoA reductase